MNWSAQVAIDEGIAAPASASFEHFHDFGTYQGTISALISLPRVHPDMHIGPLEEAR